MQGASGARYELEGQVGAGGMGAVYRATSEVETAVAVKILHRGVHEQARQRQRLLKEALIINGIRHEGIVRVLDCGVDDQDRPSS